MWGEILSAVVGLGGQALAAGGGSTQSPTSANSGLMTSNQQDIFKKYLGRINEGLAGTGGMGYSPYRGDLVADESGLQGLSFQSIQDMMQGGGLTGEAANTLKRFTQEYDPAADTQYWERAVKDPTIKAWQQDVLPGLVEKYVSRGARESGAYNRALTGSAQDLTTGLSANLAQTLQSGRQNANANAITAAGGLSGIDQVLAQLGLSAGGQQRGIENEQLQGAFQKWLADQPYNNPWMNQVGSALGIRQQGGGYVPTTTTNQYAGLSGMFGNMGTQGIEGILNRILGGGNAGAGAASASMAGTGYEGLDYAY